MDTLNIAAANILIDSLNHGLIYVDKEKKIRLANKSAKENTGINILQNEGHESGKIEAGDIVIIADNRLGEDDGNLDREDFALLNITDHDIKPGDMIIAVGVYKNKKIAPEYKYLREHQLDTPMVLHSTYYGFQIKVTIDTTKKYIEIDINEKQYRLDFFSAIGHMVVISGITGRVKFFQAKGYSVRDEEIGTLLRGNHYHSKSKDQKDIDVAGQPFLKLFDQSPLSEKLFAIIDGKAAPVSNQLYEINKRPFVCSIIPKPEGNGNISGAFLLLQDLGKMEDIISQSNEIMRQIEAKSKPCSSSKMAYPENAFEAFVGTSRQAREVKYLAYKASQNKFNVIITGASGTGKSKLAREIHKMGDPHSPFVEVNCNAIAPSLFESELFGYVRGAFTGAKNEGKTGLFETANNGTIFLDEIGEIPLDIQVKLLHVLQHKIIYRVGSSKPIKVNVRVIAATNKNLAEEVSAGHFRQDLYYRINVFPIHIPPIKSRKADLYILINQILKGFCEEYQVPLKQFSGEALEELINYDWPGNVRELENIIERAVTLCESKIIYSEHLSLIHKSPAVTLKEQLEAEEKLIIENTLHKHRGNKSQAMKELAISKTSFYEKLKKYDIK